MPTSLFKNVRTAIAGLCLLFASSHAMSAAPSPIATMDGQLRSFSPDGRYAAAVISDEIAVYETNRWTQVGRIAAGPFSFFKYLLIDNSQRLVGVWGDREKKGVFIEIWDAKGGLKSLGSQRVFDHLSIFDSAGNLSIEVYKQVFAGRSVAYRSPKAGVVHEADEYQVYRYTCSVDKYLKAAKYFSETLITSSDSESIGTYCGKGSLFKRSMDEIAFLLIDQTEVMHSREYEIGIYTGHPAIGPGKFERTRISDPTGQIYFGVTYKTEEGKP